MLNDITWKLKASECSSVIAFENLSRIISLCGFQNIWSFSVFVTMSIHSWLLFILISCWLAISEGMSLKSIISFSWIKFLEYPCLKLNRQIKSKSVWIGRTYPLTRRLCWLLKKILKYLNSWSMVCPDKTGVSGLANRTVRFWTPDMSGPPHRIPVRITGLIRPSFQTCPASYQKSQFHAKSSQIGWSLQIHLISVIM